jgi:hypothetical protein
VAEALDTALLDDVAKVLARRGRATRRRVIDWSPLPRQRMALESEATETLYGGAAGGGKSDLLLGAFRLGHRFGAIFRRTYPQLRDSIIPRSLDIYGDPRHYNASNHVWQFPDGARLAFRQLELESTVHDHQSAQYDFIGFDELTQFSESQYLYMLSRARSARPGQRVRIIAATNPGGEGNDWVMARWGAWLDPSYRGARAEPGEVRWFLRPEGQDHEVEVEPGTKDSISRTFIAAKLSDNPHLPEEYRSRLMALPEPYRSQLLNGDWQSGLTDDAWQVIPSAWIEAAQRRWTAEGHGGRPMDALGLDVALRGEDFAVKAKRHGNWIAPLEARQGRTLRESSELVDWIAPDMGLSPKAVANIDGTGWGEGAVALCRARAINHRGIVSSVGSKQHARGNPELGFANLKTEMVWRVREALDPSQAGALALPPDRNLARDLRSYRWAMGTTGAKVTGKDKQIADLGHSPDRGDAVCLAVCGFEPIGELVFDRAEGSDVCAPMKAEPVIWWHDNHCQKDRQRTWAINYKGLPQTYARVGKGLHRAVWWSRRGPSGAVWLHEDGGDGLTVFDAVRVTGRMGAAEFAMEVHKRSFDRAGVAHEYESDVFGSPQAKAVYGDRGAYDTWCVEMVNAAREHAKGKAKSFRRDPPLPEFVETGEGSRMAGGAGLDELETLIAEGRKASLGRMMVVWPAMVCDEINMARHMPDRKPLGWVGVEVEEDTQSNWALVDCLRMLMVRWAAG